MGAYFDCEDCIFATNSPKQATKHREDNPEHTVREEDE